MRETGYNVDLKTGQVTFPDGSTASAQTIGKSGPKLGLKDLPPNVAKEINSKIAHLKSALKKSSNEPINGGSRSSPYKAPSFDMDMPSFKLPKFKFGLNKRKPASVKGLQKVVGPGESIGVAGDNIFDMIARRYAKMSERKCLSKINEASLEV